MSDILIEVTRGGITESLHRGDIAVVDASGARLYSVGDPDRLCIMRSSAKPLQALNVILSGAAEKYQLTDAELAIMCASHFGEDYHWQTIQGVLDKLGLGMAHLLCGTGPQKTSMEALLKDDSALREWRQSHADCAGKHCGFLAVCMTAGFPIETYDKRENPVQQQALGIVAHMCGIAAQEVQVAEDGCGVPVFAMPLHHVALGFARLANPENLPPAYQAASERITKAMVRAPEMVAGTGGFCTELMQHSHGRLVGKMGAEGVYGVGVLGKGLGIAVKIDDGNYGRACPPTVMETLRQLDLVSATEWETLAPFVPPVEIRNNHGRQVGETRAVFQLRSA